MNFISAKCFLFFFVICITKAVFVYVSPEHVYKNAKRDAVLCRSRFEALSKCGCAQCRFRHGENFSFSTSWLIRFANISILSNSLQIGKKKNGLHFSTMAVRLKLIYHERKVHSNIIIFRIICIEFRSPNTARRCLARKHQRQVERQRRFSALFRARFS